MRSTALLKAGNSGSEDNLTKPENMSHEKFKSCIDVCYACASECEHCATACLQEDEVKKMAKCIQLDRYCADMVANFYLDFNFLVLHPFLY